MVNAVLSHHRAAGAGVLAGESRVEEGDAVLRVVPAAERAAHRHGVGDPAATLEGTARPGLSLAACSAPGPVALRRLRQSEPAFGRALRDLFLQQYRPLSALPLAEHGAGTLCRPAAPD